jgi:hypothetical protein
MRAGAKCLAIQMSVEAFPAPPIEPLILHPKRAWDYLRFLYVQRVSGFTIGDAPEFEAQCTRFFEERL